VVSCRPYRGLEDDVVVAIKGLLQGAEPWEQVMGRMEVFGEQEEE
jgi:hypothetical protein